MRLVGLLATAALLSVGVATAVMVAPSNDSTDNALLDGAPAATATPAPAPTHKRKAKPHTRKLTAAQRAERTAAVAVLRDQGYRPVKLGDYRPTRTLRVLVGRGEAGQRAFFFNGAAFLGNDASDDSERIRVLRSTDRAAVIAYSLYAQGDKACCPSGGTARVSFELKGSKLQPQSAIPLLEARRGSAD